MGNAIQHTDPYGKIMVSLTKAWDGVTLSFKDTGKGIAEDHLPHIFDRFYQVEAGGTGSGIGLSLAQELARLHGGLIEVSSKPGFGSEFVLHLPQSQVLVTEMDEPGDTALPQLEAFGNGVSATQANGPAGAPRVLIIDDHNDFRAYLREHLETTYRVLEASNGQKGLELARTFHPDLVISDLNMPVLDGGQLCQALKQAEATSDIPVILLSVSTDKRLDGLEGGADDYLAKPFEIRELLSRAANLIRTRTLLRNRFNEQLTHPNPGELASEEQVFLLKIRRAIEANLENPDFGVHELAEEVGLSPRQLRRRFKIIMDLSPADFLRNFRLEFAAQLLEARTGSVADVAYRVGYRKPTHFSKLFHKKFGKYPSEYRSTVDQSTDA